jgi:Phage Tail Collar Domain
LTEPTTVNAALIIPNTGDLVNVWGANALNPDLVAIDGFFNGVQTVSVSNANVTLSVPAGFTATPSPGPTQSQNAAIKFTGAQTANVQITLPMPGSYIVHNLTTGAFVLTFAAPGAGQVISTEQGSAHRIYNDGTNVYFTDLPAVGSYLDTCDSAVPAWVTACTVPPYLLCNGGTFSSVTYPYLYTKLGSSNVLPDFRGVVPAFLNQGTGRLTSPVNGNVLFSQGGSQAASIAQANLPVVNLTSTNLAATSSFTMAYQIGNSGVGSGAIQLANTASNSGSNSTLAISTGISGTVPLGGSGTPLATMPPATIGGIRMIRAA